MPCRLTLRCLMLTALALPLTAVDADTLYRWTDANGVVHFSDRPAPANSKVKKTTETMEVKPSTAPYNNVAEERWHGALREHGVQIRTIVIPSAAPTHSKPTGP